MQEIKIIHCKKKNFMKFMILAVNVWGFLFSNIIDEQPNLSYVTFKGNSEIWSHKDRWSLNTGLIDMKCMWTKQKEYDLLSVHDTLLSRLSWSWSYGSWIYNYLCNQCLSPLTLWVWIPHGWGVLDTTLCDKICQWLAVSQWFSPGTLVPSTTI